MLFSGKDLRRLIVPLIIEQVLAVTIGMADTIMVSSVGEAAVSGISLVDTINILLINIFAALATGGAVVCSQYLGRGEKQNACVGAKQLLLSTTALSVVIMALSLALRTVLLRLIFGSIAPDVFKNAQTYFFLSALSYPFLAIYNAGAALFRTMGNSKISMLTSFLMNVINISGNALFIFVFHMGVAGAAIASLVSRAVGAVIMLVLLKNKNNPIYLKKIFALDFKWGMVRHILNIGVPNGLENGMFQLGKILVQGLIASFGTAAIAANAIANNIASIEILPGAAIGLAMITVVGQCVGAKDYKQARMYTKKLMLITYVSMFLLNVAVLFLARPIAGLYQLSAETTKLGADLIIYHSLCCIFIWPLAFVLPNGLRAANDVRFTMVTSILSMWICRIGMSWVLAKWCGLGVLGVWVAMTLDWVFRSAAFLWRYLSGRWENKQML